MLKYCMYFIVFAAVSGSAYWTYQNSDDVVALIDTGWQDNSIVTFEIATTPDAIAQKAQKELLRTAEHTFGKSSVKFAPFLLMDVKYTHDRKTAESTVLWSMEHGEMVLDTANFEMTKGFVECITSRATDEDFRILHVLMRHGGSAARQGLSEELSIDPEVLTERLDILRKKHLISLREDTVRLHFQNPLLKIEPHTKITHPLVLKRVARELQLRPRYSKEELRKVAKAAFGQDFAIHSEQIVFLPIFLIEVNNPDGSTLKTYWNGLTEKKLDLKGFY